MHKEKKRIHISLAHFDEQGNAEEEKTDKGNKATYQKLINMLEGKIFNQLLHQVDPSRIPKARFQRKEDMSLRKGIYRQRKTRGRFFCPGSQEQRGRNANCVPPSLYASVLVLASILCRFAKPLQILNRIKGKGQRHISSLDLRLPIHEDDSLYGSFLNCKPFIHFLALLRRLH